MICKFRPANLDVVTMEGPTTMRFSASSFENLKTIGVGKESTIYSAQCLKLGGATVAIKVYLKSRTSAPKLRAIKREASLMQYMLKKSVNSITRFFGAFTDEEHICIVMEYCPRGDLLELLLAEDRAFSEPRVAHVAVSLLSTLQRMHKLHLIHRDVKLENIFITNDGELKLGDFGLTMSTRQETAISPVGTSEYMAPEVVRLPRVELVTSGIADLRSITPCTSAVDIWALGITLYELLSGHLPYEMRDKAEMKEAILRGELRPLPSSISPAARSFLGAMLQPDVSLRATAGQLLEHPFLKQPPPPFCGSPRSVLSPVTRAVPKTASPSTSSAAPSHRQLHEDCQLQPSPSLQAKLRMLVIPDASKSAVLPSPARSPWPVNSPVRIRGPTICQVPPIPEEAYATPASLASPASHDVATREAMSNSNRVPINRVSASSAFAAAASLTEAFRRCGDGAGCGRAALPLLPDPTQSRSPLRTHPSGHQLMTPANLASSLAPGHDPPGNVHSADWRDPSVPAASDVSPDSPTTSVMPTWQSPTADMATPAEAVQKPWISVDDPHAPFTRGRPGWEALSISMTPSVMGPNGAHLLSPYSPAAVNTPACCSSEEDSPMVPLQGERRRCLSSGCSRPPGSVPPWSRATVLPPYKLGDGAGSSVCYHSNGNGSSSSGGIPGCSSGSTTSNSEEVLSWRRGVDPAGGEVSLAWSPVRFLQQLSCLLVPTYIVAAN